MILCCFGFSEKYFREKLSFLREDSQRRLIFVDEKKRQIDHPQVKTYHLESPLQIHSISMQIAEDAVLFPIEIVNLSTSSLFSSFKKTLLAKHRLSSLLLSDVADFGCQAARNAKVNLSKPFHLIDDLKDAFKGIPAILVGAGPSLEDDAPHIASLQSNALIFAGGHALEKLPTKAHFGAVIDKNPISFTPKDLNIPLFFLARAHPLQWKAKRFLVPDSHLTFLNFLSNTGGSFEGGWTVGNFMAQIACYLGCNPIICSGMDYCYKDGKKYAFDTSTSTHKSQDFEEAVLWMEDLAKKNPKQRFFKTKGGLSYFPECDLASFKGKELPNIDQILAKIKQHTSYPMKDWKMALQKKEELIYEELLFPLWERWRAVFARECKALEIDAHRVLFFDSVIKEHLDAIN